MKTEKTSHNQIASVRPPIVTIMGHVDHGKTSLLDYIRKTNVASREAGGITQSIGAYQAIYKTKKITFIDTPGHAIFTQMRAQGGKAADIVVLVVAADDGVMPQTKEAISHAKAAGAPIIVAINKMDAPGANPQKVKQQLAESEVQVEDWGGDVISCEVSAKTGDGVEKLLESIVTLAEMLELKANANGDLEGVIIESKIDPKKGAVFSGIVKNGSLKVGQEIYAGGMVSKVRSIIDFNGQPMQLAIPGDPVEILGFAHAPRVGELFVDPKNKTLVETKQEESKAEEAVGEHVKVVNLIVRSATEGSLEALHTALKKLENDEVKLKFLHKGTGDVTESDVLLASTSKALIVGFNCKVPAKVADLADNLQVSVHTFNIIYELLDNIEDVLKEAIRKEEIKVKGRAVVVQLFPLKSGDIVAGCKVIGGVLRPSVKINVYRGEDFEHSLYSGKIKELKRGKENVNVVGKDVECGVMLNPVFSEIKAGDFIDVI